VYSVTGDPEALGFALDLAATVVSDFYDEADGTIYFTRDPDGNAGHGGDDTLFARPQEFTDQSTPSSLGVAAETLALLDGFRTDREFAEVAETVVTTPRGPDPREPAGTRLARARRRPRRLRRIEVTIAVDAVPDAWARDARGSATCRARSSPRAPTEDGLAAWLDRLDMDEAPPIWADRDAVDGGRPPTSVRGARARRRRPTSTRRWVAGGAAQI